jgi:two-component system sensor histidine kinase BaeS
MKLRIGTKLFVAMLLSLVIPLGAMMVSVHWSFREGFSDYLHQVDLERLGKLVTRLSTAYQVHGSWRFLKEDPLVWRDLLFETIEEQGRAPRGPASGAHNVAGANRMPDDRIPPPYGPPLPHLRPPGMPPPFGLGPPPHVRDPLQLGLRVRLLGADRHEVVSPLAPFSVESRSFRQASFLPVTVGETPVGWLQVSRNTIISDRLALAFVQQQVRSNLLILLLALVAASIASALFARQIVRPLRRIAAGTKMLSSGRFDVSLPGGTDELGDLARDFNLLALSLKRNEQARRQWVADVSHELRTPVAVLRGEIEALQDGVRRPTAERIESLHEEILSLSKLVDDLYDLSLSDLGTLSYQRESLDVSALLARSVESYRGRLASHGIETATETPGPVWIFGDPQRLTQLFGNLLENTFRYTNPNGCCRVSLECVAENAVIRFDDSAPCVPVTSLGRLFERLYRVEGSRSREYGGAGLGLAICRNIVEAHGGQISAVESDLGGLCILIELPCLNGVGGESHGD